MTAMVQRLSLAVAPRAESRFAFSNRTSVESLPALIRAIEPHKPAAALAEYAGSGQRAAELAMKSGGLSRRALTNLLRSRIGDRVLDFLLGEQPPAWRAAELRLMGVAHLEQELEKLEQKKRHLEALLAQTAR